MLSGDHQRELLAKKQPKECQLAIHIDFVRVSVLLGCNGKDACSYAA